MFLMIALIVAIISALFWIFEITQGLNNAEKVMEECRGSVAKTIGAGPRIVLGFWGFIADLLVTSFFLSFFMVSGVTGFVVGIAISDVFSIWILIRMLKGKKETK